MQHLRLNPDLDVDALAQVYRAHTRVRIANLLKPQDADRLHAYLGAQDDWWHMISTPDGVLELDRKTRARMSAKRRAALDDAVFARARAGFQYRYEGLLVPDDPDELDVEDEPLAAFAALMASDAMLGLLRQVTGYRDIGLAGGHATAYGPGDFLTCHDDNVAGKNRRAAYVLGMTREWRAEWGGILMFHESAGVLVTGHVPSFNTLDLFAVPQPHSVSIVTPSAPARRFALTGWLSTI